MGATTHIEWTDATWNPVTGCTKVSPGCDHCYAERVTERFHGPGSFATVQMHPDRLDLPLHWRKPRKVFVNSMSDLFHDDVPDRFIAEIFAVMLLAPMHTFQVLTKRHARMRALLNSDDFWTVVGERAGVRVGAPMAGLASKVIPWVWLGVSVESQQWADIRIPALLETPAAVRFLSCEPLLGPIDLRSVNSPKLGGITWLNVLRPGGVDWVIVGGESGKDARPMRPKWARDIRDQCVEDRVPFLFKQWGEFAPARSGEAWQVGEEFWPIWRYGKKSAGRELDGRTWDEYPSVGAA